MTRKYFIELAKRTIEHPNFNKESFQLVVDILDATYVKFDRKIFINYINKRTNNKYEIK